MFSFNVICRDMGRFRGMFGMDHVRKGHDNTVVR
jgi:hypothetical protein